MLSLLPLYAITVIKMLSLLPLYAITVIFLSFTYQLCVSIDYSTLCFLDVSWPQLFLWIQL